MSLPTAPGPRPAFGIYVHIPFCLVRCAYCDFNAYAGMEELRPAYVEALISEITGRADGGRVDTVFFGGGTPTMLDASDLRRVLSAVRDGFTLAPDAEITIEANPETVDEPAFEALLEAGFNRVSIGVQSLDTGALSFLDRAHGPRRALDALAEARAAGFRRVNADLIYGTPGESVAAFRDSIQRVVDTGVDHVSAYALTVEEGTPLHVRVANGASPAPDPDDQAEKFALAERELREAGMQRYEVSNWAAPGSWSRHNLGYWRADDYLGFGAGAHSHLSGRRFWNVKLPRTYIQAAREGVPAAEDGESLDHAQRTEEAAMLGLRLAGGLDRQLFAQRWGVDPLIGFGGSLAEHIAEGRVLLDDRAVRIAPEAAFTSSWVLTSVLGGLVPTAGGG